MISNDKNCKGVLLLAEKDIDTINKIKEILSDCPLDILVVKSGAELYKKIFNVNIHLVLLSTELEDLSGFEVCTKLRDIYKTSDIPIIMITKDINSETISNIFDSGSIDYLKKPINQVELKSRVKTHIELRNSYKELEKKNNKLEEKERVVKTQMKLAKRIQQSFFNQPFPTNDFLKFSTIYKPIDDIGGDFYDFILRREGDIGVLMSDVSGHGIPAALITSMLKMICTFKRRYSDTPNLFLKELNQVLVNKIEGNFITAFYGFFNLLEKTFTYSNAGHSNPFLYKSSEDKVIELVSKGPILGVIESIKDYEMHTISISKGDKILLYTDGLIEGINTSSIYGKDFLNKALAKYKNEDINDCVKNIYSDFLEQQDESSHSIHDDVTILGVEVID